MSVEDDDEQDDAARTIVAGPSFDELMAAVAEPSNEDAGIAVDARSYDQRLAEIEASSQPLAYAQPASAPPYDARVASAGLANHEADEPAPSAPLPKTMILSPGDWGGPPAAAQPPMPVASPAPLASTGSQPHLAASPAPYAPQPFAPAVASAPARKSGLAIFLITALVTVVLGSCAAGVVALLVLRS